LALVVHELATNSIKYGSLSTADGTLEVSCSVADDDVIIVWTETGGPPVSVSRGQAGFGSTLVHRCITGQLGGVIAFDWPASGVIVTLRMSKARLGA
jgi:two-component sensor histidine kinase